MRISKRAVYNCLLLKIVYRLKDKKLKQRMSMSANICPASERSVEENKQHVKITGERHSHGVYCRLRV